MKTVKLKITSDLYADLEQYKNIKEKYGSYVGVGDTILDQIFNAIEKNDPELILSYDKQDSKKNIKIIKTPKSESIKISNELYDMLLMFLLYPDDIDYDNNIVTYKIKRRNDLILKLSTYQ